MTSKETVQRCRRCNLAIPDGGQMLCMGVQPIALIEDVTDDDCPKRRGTPEALVNKKRPGRKPKVAKEPEAKAAPPDPRTDPDRSGQDLSEPAKEMPAPEPVETAADPVHHPNHYTWKGEECITLIRIMCREEEGFDGYCKGNVVKYLFRETKKNGLEDLKKARVYLNLLINYREGKEAVAKSKRGGRTNA